MIKTSDFLNVMKTLKEREEKRRKDQEEDDQPPWQRRLSPSPPLDSPRFSVDSEEEVEEVEEVNWGHIMYDDGPRR